MKTLLAPDSVAAPTLSPPFSELDRAAIGTQLYRLLASPRFSSSKRCAILLRHVVLATVEGHDEQLKERVLGVEVFARVPDYDTNGDPVVRVAAGEVRKRLAQYYYEPAHAGEIVIEMPSGSYVPRFHFPVVEPAREERPAGPPSGQVRAVSEMGAGAISEKRKSQKRWLVLAFISILALVGITVTVARVWWPPSSALDYFWSSIFDSPGPALVCMGQMKATLVSLDPNGLRSHFGEPLKLGSGGVYPKEIPITVLSDAVIMADVVGRLKAAGKPYLIRGEALTSFQDLQKGPSVLIGAFNNDWTIRLTDSMRFHFEMSPDKEEWWIADRQKSDARIGSLNMATPYPSMKTDFGVVARIFDPTTKQPVVILAGLTPLGTHAVGEFVTNPTYLGDAARQFPKDWYRRNMELVIQTNIIDGEDGPPHVVSSYFW